MDASHSTNSQGKDRSSLRCLIFAVFLLLAGAVGMTIFSGRLSPLEPNSEHLLHLFVARRKKWQLAVQHLEHGIIWTSLAAPVLRRIPAIKDGTR